MAVIVTNFRPTLLNIGKQITYSIDVINTFTKNNAEQITVIIQPQVSGIQIISPPPPIASISPGKRRTVKFTLREINAPLGSYRIRFTTRCRLIPLPTPSQYTHTDERSISVRP